VALLGRLVAHHDVFQRRRGLRLLVPHHGPPHHAREHRARKVVAREPTLRAFTFFSCELRIFEV
jgi:hypothetical protein